MGCHVPGPHSSEEVEPGPYPGPTPTAIPSAPRLCLEPRESRLGRRLPLPLALEQALLTSTGSLSLTHALQGLWSKAGISPGLTCLFSGTPCQYGLVPPNSRNTRDAPTSSF